MVTAEKAWRPFVLLTANATKLGQRALHSVFELSGYTMVSADSGRDVLSMVPAVLPDAVILDTDLPGMTGLETCRQLNGDPGFSPTCPIFLISAHGTSLEERHLAYSAGAWEVCSQPLDGEALLLKLAIYLRARQSSERLRNETLIEESGLYNAQGLRRRMQELGADAARRREPLACVTFEPSSSGRPGVADPALTEQVAEEIRRHARASDVLGRIGPAALALLAPATDAEGALGLIDRLGALFNERPFAGTAPWPPVTLRTGYFATSNFADSSLEPEDMLDRALAVLRDASRAPAGQSEA